MSDEETTRNIKVAAQCMLASGFVLSAVAIWRDSRISSIKLSGGNFKNLGDGNFGNKVRQLPNIKLPTTEAQAQKLGRPKLKQYDVNDIDTRAGLIGELIRKGSLNPDLREHTVRIVSQKVGGRWAVPEKDCLGEVKMLFTSYRDPKSVYAVRYTRDAMLADVFTAPERTLLKSHGGDCFVKGTMVLRREGHALVPIETLRVGDEIWGHNDWSKVTKTWEKGILPTVSVQLNNGSAMRLTKDHKVWIYKCRKEHRGERASNCECSMEHRDLVRITVGELRKGMVLPQPERVSFGTGKMDAGAALIEGLYLSDGWSSHRADFAIAGKDGHSKEAQKREVEKICKEMGLKTRWHSRYITVKSREWTDRLRTMGSHAPQKHALSIDLDEGGALNLLRGIMADAGKNTHGTGSTFTTTSHELFLQTRVLLKMAGLTAGSAFITDHGGLGENPIWRLYVRGEQKKKNKLLRVKEVVTTKIELPCFDIETHDHFVWLPEADWTTSQCDDASIVLGSQLMSIGHPVRMRIVATKNPKFADAQAPWSHIYLLTPTTFDNPNAKWISVDATMDKPLGWEAPGAAECARTGKGSGIIARVRDYTLMRPAEQG